MARPRKRQDSRTNGALRAITYGRVSTGRQAASGISLDDQADKLAEVVSSRGWVHIAHLTDPGLSGRKMTNRRGLQDALGRLDRNEADVLVAAKIDRVSRSTTDFARLLDQAEKKGWKLIVLDADVDTTTAAGRLLVDVVSAAASFESRRIGERAKSVHAIRRAQGKRAGQPPLLPDEVRLRIAADHAEGRSLNSIAAVLNVEGVPTAKGGRWHASTISHVVQSVEVDNELVKVRQEVPVLDQQKEAKMPRSVYDPLREYLLGRTEPFVKMTFAQVERILGRRLPASARDHQAWWANEVGGTHSHARAWLDANRRTRGLDLNAATVEFVR